MIETERALVASEEGATADMDRDRLLAKVCYPGVVMVTCVGDEAQRLTKVFQDAQGDISYPDLISGVWYQDRMKRLTF